MISIYDEVNYTGKDLDVKNPAEVVGVTGDNEIDLYDIEDKAGNVFRVGADEIEAVVKLVVKTEVPAEDTQSGYNPKFKVGDKVKVVLGGGGFPERLLNVVGTLERNLGLTVWSIRYEGESRSWGAIEFEMVPAADTTPPYTPPCKTRALDPKPTEPHVTFALRNAEFTATGTGLTVTINNESVTLTKSESETLATLVMGFVV